MDPSIMMQSQEAMRRRAGMPPSGAGINSGAVSAPGGPIANAGQSFSPGAPGAGGFPSTGGVEELSKQTPDEATYIVKALADRLKKLSNSLNPPAESSTPSAPATPNIPTNGADIVAAAAAASGISP